MMIVWGSGNYGRCDTVPGLCHVVTRFGHLYYVPLIPTATYAVISEDSDGFRGATIPMSLKSVMLAWSRAVLLLGSIAGIVLLIMGLVSEIQRGPTMIAGGAVLAFCGVLLLATYRLQTFNIASRQRALELAELLGIDEEGLQTIGEMYDAMETPTPDDDFEFEPGFVAEDPRFTNVEN
ncbi:MAG: hypothetical protein Fues2KO_06990 [Fuerstiella sp.]